VKRAAIEQQNQALLRRQREFRLAADVVTDAWMAFAEVQAVAVIGSVAKVLWKGIPRCPDFRRAGIEVRHECGDLDLSLWIDSQKQIGSLRRAAAHALRAAFEHGAGTSVVSQQLDVFMIEPAVIATLAGFVRSTLVRRANGTAWCRVAARFPSTK
jgi:hypothetical protein